MEHNKINCPGMRLKPERTGVFWTAMAATAVALTLAMRTDLKVVRYVVESPKLNAGLRLALLTDLHSCGYGDGQRKLLDLLHRQEPDAVLLGGDIVDDKLPSQGAMTVLRELGARYPCFYVCGNHEFYGGRAQQIKARLTKLGIRVLAGDAQPLQVRAQTICIAGVDDPEGGEAAFEAQLARCAQAVEPSQFTVLLTHRPERVDAYRSCGFDLFLAGHAHGGQWRIPGVLNGLVAPNQGLFPPYAGGLYSFSGSNLIVSRGLARESTLVPRIFNRPELVLVDLTPA